MKVQPISYGIIDNKNNVFECKRTNVQKSCSTDVFQPSFKGYSDVLYKLAQEDYKNAGAVKEAFSRLITAVAQDTKVPKNPEFNDFVKSLCFPDLAITMENLRQPMSTNKFKALLEQRKDILLAGDSHREKVLELINKGKFGFIKHISNCDNAPFKTEFLFESSTPNVFMTFGQTSKGNYTLTQASHDYITYSVFDRFTGDLKRLSELNNAINQVTFYHKDGTPNVLMNTLFSHIAALFF